MKKILKSILAMLILPILLLTACKSSLKPINLKYYFNENVICGINGKSETTTISIDDITQSKPNNNNLGKYTSFKIDSIPALIYKMYIEKIEFYIYTSKSSIFELTTDVSISNLATEEELLKDSTELADTFNLEESYSISPKSGKSFKVSVPVNATVATPTGTQITISLSDSDLFLENGENNNFSWLIYGFKIYGESRAYSK